MEILGFGIRCGTGAKSDMSGYAPVPQFITIFSNYSLLFAPFGLPSLFFPMGDPILIVSLHVVHHVVDRSLRRETRVAYNTAEAEFIAAKPRLFLNTLLFQFLIPGLLHNSPSFHEHIFLTLSVVPFLDRINHKI